LGSKDSRSTGLSLVGILYLHHSACRAVTVGLVIVLEVDGEGEGFDERGKCGGDDMRRDGDGEVVDADGNRVNNHATRSHLIRRG
jgi:hypothetical protein